MRSVCTSLMMYKTESFYTHDIIRLFCILISVFSQKSHSFWDVIMEWMSTWDCMSHLTESLIASRASRTSRSQSLEVITDSRSNFVERPKKVVCHNIWFLFNFKDLKKWALHFFHSWYQDLIAKRCENFSNIVSLHYATSYLFFDLLYEKIVYSWIPNKCTSVHQSWPWPHTYTVRWSATFFSRVRSDMRKDEKMFFILVVKWPRWWFVQLSSRIGKIGGGYRSGYIIYILDFFWPENPFLTCNFLM